MSPVQLEEIEAIPKGPQTLPFRNALWEAHRPTIHTTHKIMPLTIFPQAHTRTKLQLTTYSFIARLLFFFPI